MTLTFMRCPYCHGKSIEAQRTYTIHCGAPRTLYHCSPCARSFSETRHTPAVGAGPAVAPGEAALAVPEPQREPWADRVAIMVIDGGLPHADAERLAWAGLQTPGAAP